MNVNSKINKIRLAHKNGNLKSLLHSKLKEKEYRIKLKLMHKGTTSYVKDAIEAELGRRYIEKEYAWYLDSPKKNYVIGKELPLPKVIWWCWFQGLNEAPPLVKMCFDSIRRNFRGYKINVITLDNLKKYVDIPNYIMIKFKSGIISYAQFSDIIRILLLAKYGGVWIDSTVYCSNSRIVSIIEKQDFFVYQNGLLGNNQDIKISSWFMSAKQKNIFVSEVKELMLHYWKNHDFLENYFLLHLFFTLVSEKYPEEWKKVPVFNNVSPHMMVRELNESFSQDRYNQLNSFSSLHKLNHHVEFNSNSDTLYRWLLQKSENYQENYN